MPCLGAYSPYSKLLSAPLSTRNFSKAKYLKHIKFLSIHLTTLSYIRTQDFLQEEGVRIPYNEVTPLPSPLLCPNKAHPITLSGFPHFSLSCRVVYQAEAFFNVCLLAPTKSEVLIFSLGQLRGTQCRNLEDVIKMYRDIVISRISLIEVSKMSSSVFYRKKTYRYIV